MVLEALVDKNIAEFGLEQSGAEIGIEFLLGENMQGSSTKNDALENKLQLFLYMAGKIPITLKEGRKRIRYVHDLRLLGYSDFDFHSEKIIFVL